MKMNVIVKTLIVGGVCVASMACQSKKSAETAVVVEEKPKVTTEVVNLQDVEQQSTFTGNVEGFAVNNITPQQPRRIARLLVDVGDHVRAGQKLAEMENSALAQAKAQYDNNKANFERADELYKFGGESKANWESMKTAYEVSKLTYENMLENTSLISPISGLVTARNYDVGDMVVASPIFVVQQINPVKIYINVSESLYSYIKKGMSVDVELDAIPEKKFEGKVSRITPLIDPQTRTFEVELTVANGKEEIKPGMYARATMSYGSRKNVVVPDRAVVKMMGSGDRFIYVLKADGTVSYQKVELGRRMNDKFEVLSGVADGDEVVVSGQSALKNGIAVERVK
ncbi:MAG: efflux RND transporter periplasmic adaptor subunit [Alistipes sp.]|jgi:RND family efflux transporter MFP subunit|nr:efflux RND transporter periplasmic adaptor subunit [Alistipes sp.]MBQ5704741.1 efflux RND transporter periplasmic adaptor subunit [Alistipes sp.]MBQ5921745.1 efflux RND transporter periplasmic adaptor subunit [Alistipes sp.]MBQ6581818.1 efflux RND transporter periplasmic adaptor subunit [Alistipes sp.]